MLVFRSVKGVDTGRRLLSIFRALLKKLFQKFKPSQTNRCADLSEGALLPNVYRNISLHNTFLLFSGLSTELLHISSMHLTSLLILRERSTP